MKSLLLLIEQYRTAIDKCYVQSLNDPESNPYKSKYEARQMFETMREIEIDEESEIMQHALATLDLTTDEEQPKFILATSQTPESSVSKKHRHLIRILLDYHIGTIYNDTEEKSEGESRLRTVLTSIEQAIQHPLLCSLGLHILNQLLLIRASFDQFNDALQIADRAQQLYNDTSTIEPYRLEELILIESKVDHCRNEFEQIYTHTLFYLAQIYGKLDRKDRSADYCRLTLERQLANRNSPLFDPLDWATNCATLSQYYMTNRDYATARHCLMCADQMLENVKPSTEKLIERTASFKRCWIKYAINLLEDSSDRLLEAADRDVDPNQISQSSSTPQFQFQLSLPNQEPITSEFVLDYSQARQVFLFAMEKIRAAKSFYILDGFVTDHVELCQDTSQLYGKLIFFESNIERKCKMTKRRIDLLAHLCQELNEEHYLAIVRQLLFELGECYSILLDLKLQQEKQDSNKKVSHLATLGIATFERFLATMRDKKTQQTPETYAEENVRPALIAHFYLGRFHSKFPANRLDHMEQSLVEYRTIVDYVDRHPNIRTCVDREYVTCKEMTELLPYKIERLRCEKH